MSKAKKLEMVPATSTSSALASPQVSALLKDADIPKNVKKLTMPPMLKPDSIPVGKMAAGEVLALANSISGRADMRESKLIHMRHENGSEFLLPLTGVIKKAVGGNEGVEKIVGRTLCVVRQPDGETVKYGGKKKVFMFDVYLAD